ncbi:MAG: hypothetical protein AAFO94_08210 [Bacteroidota bacterium]
MDSYPVYTAIGQLFYAIAACDKTIRPEEKEVLRKALRQSWLPADQAAMAIAYEFRRLLDSSPDAWNSYHFFENYWNGHRDQFTDDIADRIRKTANAIADVVGGKNKSELVMLSRLDGLLKA